LILQTLWASWCGFLCVVQTEGTRCHLFGLWHFVGSTVRTGDTNLLFNGHRKRVGRGALYLVVKKSGEEADNSPPSSAKVMNAWYCTSIPVYARMACMTHTLLSFTGRPHGLPAKAMHNNHTHIMPWAWVHKPSDTTCPSHYHKLWNRASSEMSVSLVRHRATRRLKLIVIEMFVAAPTY